MECEIKMSTLREKLEAIGVSVYETGYDLSDEDLVNAGVIGNENPEELFNKLTKYVRRFD